MSYRRARIQLNRQRSLCDEQMMKMLVSGIPQGKKCYFCVECKFGHVGRERYYRGKLFIQAPTAKDAALIARWTPRVKHHHPDAILSVTEISYLQYREGIQENQKKLYFNVHDKKYQAAVMEEICDLVFEDEIALNCYKKRKWKKQIKNEGGIERCC